MDTLNYLAYGSNLHPLRLRERVPSAGVLGIVMLSGCRLSFSKRGKDGSGKCHLRQTGNDTDSAYAVLYRIAAEHKSWLDRIEGLGRGYSEAWLQVRLDNTTCPAFTYLAQSTHMDFSLLPFDWYKALVVEGAIYHALPAGYIEMLQAVESVRDPDSRRRTQNRSTLAAIRACNRQEAAAVPWDARGNTVQLIQSAAFMLKES